MTEPLDEDAFLRAVAAAPEETPRSGSADRTVDLLFGASPGRGRSGALATAGDGGPGSPDEPSFASGRFLVRRRLGAGGFGIVYEAFDRERNATVALKALRRRDGSSISRFKSEFRSLVETVHDNLVQIYELHAEGDSWLFTMEFVRGVDALTYVRPAGASFDEARLRAVFRQIAEGLSFLHLSNKLHRDVKPSNVMVTGEGRVVIVDFGLVSDIRDESAARSVFGTPAYMAPEQAAGQAAGTAGDWYSVGVMLYQALTGRLPPPDAGLPGDAVPGVPDDLDRLCGELLAPVPERRPTGREVRRRLSAEAPGADAAALPATTGLDDRTVAAEASFVGRAAQLGELRGALRAADAGAATTVLLCGPSGIGKSALLRHFLAEVRARDPRRLVLFGRCFEQESVPYKAVDGLIDDLRRCLRARAPGPVAHTLPADFPLLERLFPQLRGRAAAPAQPQEDSIDDPALRGRAFAALGELLAEVSVEAPVLVVDDLQWGDLDSVALLAKLLHGPRPMLLVASYRAEDAAANPVLHAFLAALGDVAERVTVRAVEVGALDEHEAQALCRSLLDTGAPAHEGPTTEAMRALVEEARGDPFLLTELARHDGTARRTGPRPDTRGDGAARAMPRLSTLLAARIGALPESARRLLEVVALEGQPITRALAATAAFGNEGASEALAAVSVLRAERLIRSRRGDGGDEILPYHDHVREAVTGALDPAAGRAYHHRLAMALEAAGGAEPERLLFHYRSAGRLADAARHAHGAAMLAHQALAFDRAARLYREALELGPARTDLDGKPRPQTPDEDRAICVALADALAGAGRPREAALAYLEAVRGAEPTDRLAWSRLAAEHLLGAGYAEEGLATLRDVLGEVGVRLSTSLPRSLAGYGALRARLWARGLDFREQQEATIGKRDLLRLDASYTAAVGLFLVNPILAAESQARHLLLALQVGEPFRVARALALEAVFAVFRRAGGHSTDRPLETARLLEQRMARPQLTGFLRLCESLIAQITGHWRPALDLVVESESVLSGRCTGVSLELDLARTRRVEILWLLGEVRELARVAPQLLDDARERGNRFMEMMVQLSAASIVGLVEGRPDRARQAVAAALEQCSPERGSLLHTREVRAVARIALYEGRGHDALAAIDEGISAMRRTGLSLARAVTAELAALRAVAALSVNDDAGAARCARSLRRLGFPWARDSALLVEAALARRAGDVDRAIALLARFRDTARHQGNALYDAATSRRLGEWAGGSDGRAEVEAADAWMAEQGIADPERITATMLGWG